MHLSFTYLLTPLLLVCLSCGNSARDTAQEPTPPSACSESSDCEGAPCVCGLCTSSCSTETANCETGFSCYGPGSLGHRAACDADNTSKGVCLKACAVTAQCGEGQQCIAGGCLVPRLAPAQPIKSVALPDAGLPTVASPAVGLGVASVGFKPEEQWVSPVTELSLVDEGTIAAASGCRFNPPCTTLETALRGDACLNVQAGCGLVHVRGPIEGWYDDFGSLPVALSSPPVTSRDIECDAVEVSCWSCEGRGPLCETAPIRWPVQPPTEAPAGCTCEAEGPTRARVSLDCFCSVYPCPSLDELLAPPCQTSTSSSSSMYVVDRAQFSCGLVWLGEAVTSGEMYGFDPVTAQLKAAHSFSPGGPVSAPCNTFAVHAGERTACGDTLAWRDPFSNLQRESQTIESCRCVRGTESSPNDLENDCNAQSWFLQLLASAGL